MEYRKFKADYLFNGYQMLDNAQVLITDIEGKLLTLSQKMKQVKE